MNRPRLTCRINRQACSHLEDSRRNVASTLSKVVSQLIWRRAASASRAAPRVSATMVVWSMLRARMAVGQVSDPLREPKQYFVAVSWMMSSTSVTLSSSLRSMPQKISKRANLIKNQSRSLAPTYSFLRSKRNNLRKSGARKRNLRWSCRSCRHSLPAVLKLRKRPSVSMLYLKMN